MKTAWMTDGETHRLAVHPAPLNVVYLRASVRQVFLTLPIRKPGALPVDSGSYRLPLFEIITAIFIHRFRAPEGFTW
jgi:hypothetical protein